MKVIGLGDNVVDKYLYLDTMFPGGNALNFSVYAREYGIDSSYLGVFGNDEAAKHILSVLKQKDIDISHCRYYEGENGYSEVDLVEGDRVFIGGNGGGVSIMNPIVLNEEDLNYLNSFQIIHTSCYSNIEQELPKLKKLSIPISFDFSYKIEFEYLEKICPYINYSFLSCSHLDEEDIKILLKKIINYGCELAIGTRGVKGAILYDGKNYFHQKANIVLPKDTLGAGDSFLTAFLIYYMKNKDKNKKQEVIKNALSIGSEFAAHTCLVQGAFGHGKKYK